MAKAKTLNPARLIEIKVVGYRPENMPYIRLAYIDPEGTELSFGYLGSIENANVMRGLANQILRALDGE